MIGFSVRPCPARTPIVALQDAGKSFNLPLGSLTRTLLPILVSTKAEFPPDRANLPPSPGLASTLHTGVPSGILSSMVTLPGLSVTFEEKAIFWPMLILVMVESQYQVTQILNRSLLTTILPDDHGIGA